MPHTRVRRCLIGVLRLMIILVSPIMSPLSVKALCVVIVGTVTGHIRDWLSGKRDAVQNSV
jgi:hypothetical protein